TVTPGLKDSAGLSFKSLEVAFKTGNADTSGPPLPSVKFNQYPLANTLGNNVFSLVIGPDHKLYAGTSDGTVLRYKINDSGTLGTPDVISTIVDNNNGNKRWIVGLAFD